MLLCTRLPFERTSQFTALSSSESTFSPSDLFTCGLGENCSGVSCSLATLVFDPCPFFIVMSVMRLQVN